MKLFKLILSSSPCRFVLPPFLTLKNFEGLDLGKMDQVSRRIDISLICASSSCKNLFMYNLKLSSCCRLMTLA